MGIKVWDAYGVVVKKKKLPISQRRAPEYQNKLSMRYFIIVAKVSNKIEYPKNFPVIFY